MTFTPEFVLQLVISGGACAAVYAAIRADLAKAIAMAENATKSAGRAHNRIDDFLHLGKP